MGGRGSASVLFQVAGFPIAFPVSLVGFLSNVAAVNYSWASSNPAWKFPSSISHANKQYIKVCERIE